MKKYQYFLYQNVRVADDIGVYSGVITAIDNGLYKVEYDCGGYDWLLYDELMPEYSLGDYVITAIGIGKITAISDYDFYKVSFNRNKYRYYNEYEMKPTYKPSLWAKVVGLLW